MTIDAIGAFSRAVEAASGDPDATYDLLTFARSFSGLDAGPFYPAPAGAAARACAVFADAGLAPSDYSLSALAADADPRSALSAVQVLDTPASRAFLAGMARLRDAVPLAGDDGSGLAAAVASVDRTPVEAAEPAPAPAPAPDAAPDGPAAPAAPTTPLHAALLRSLSALGEHGAPAVESMQSGRELPPAWAIEEAVRGTREPDDLDDGLMKIALECKALEDILSDSSSRLFLPRAAHSLSLVRPAWPEDAEHDAPVPYGLLSAAPPSFYMRIPKLSRYLTADAAVAETARHPADGPAAGQCVAVFEIPLVLDGPDEKWAARLSVYSRPLRFWSYVFAVLQAATGGEFDLTPLPGSRILSSAGSTPDLALACMDSPLVAVAVALVSPGGSRPQPLSAYVRELFATDRTPGMPSLPLGELHDDDPYDMYMFGSRHEQALWAAATLGVPTSPFGGFADVDAARRGCTSLGTPAESVRAFDYMLSSHDGRFAAEVASAHRGYDYASEGPHANATEAVKAAFASLRNAGMAPCRAELSSFATHRDDGFTNGMTQEFYAVVENAVGGRVVAAYPLVVHGPSIANVRPALERRESPFARASPFARGDLGWPSWYQLRIELGPRGEEPAGTGESFDYDRVHNIIKRAFADLVLQCGPGPDALVHLVGRIHSADADRYRDAAEAMRKFRSGNYDALDLHVVVVRGPDGSAAVDIAAAQSVGFAATISKKFEFGCNVGDSDSLIAEHSCAALALPRGFGAYDVLNSIAERHSCDGSECAPNMTPGRYATWRAHGTNAPACGRIGPAVSSAMRAELGDQGAWTPENLADFDASGFKSANADAAHACRPNHTARLSWGHGGELSSAGLL